MYPADKRKLVVKELSKFTDNPWHRESIALLDKALNRKVGRKVRKPREDKQ